MQALILPTLFDRLVHHPAGCDRLIASCIPTARGYLAPAGRVTTFFLSVCQICISGALLVCVYTVVMRSEDPATDVLGTLLAT